MTADSPDAAFEDGVLVSRRFGDVYASRAGALAQSRAVFLAGNQLPARWAGRAHFTVAELGFGTGLNMLALLDMWRLHRPPGATLVCVSTEAFPLGRAEAAQALAAYPELAPLAAGLLAQWPAPRRGWVRLDFPALGATLDLALMDAHAALAGWTGTADAWFLDGFSPARNPDMWSDALLALVGARTAPGGTAATWSAAGHVRRALSAAGFTVERRPGFGGKRDRIEAAMPGAPIPAAASRSVAIVGAGIAGASLARAFRHLGCSPRIFAGGPMASGNPAALVSPRLAAGSGAAAALHAQAFLRAVQCIRHDAPDAVIASGAVRLLKPSERDRAAATIASGLFPAESLRLDDAALHMADALVVAPGRLREAWLGSSIARAVPAPQPDARGWRLGGEGPFDAVVLAAGFATAALAGVPLRPIRGQVATAPIPPGHPPTSWGGYLIPTDDGLLFGATHARGDARDDIRDDDTRANLAGLAGRFPTLAAQLETVSLGARAGVRAAAGDHQPMAGMLAPGLHILSALGGRGFALAPLLAEHVAATVLERPSPLPAPLAALVDPRRTGAGPQAR